MEDFKQVYLKGLPLRIEKLEGHIRAVRQGKPDAEKAARAFAHSLGGSGGTYGFPQVSTAAKEAEKAPGPVLVQKMEALLEVLTALKEKEGRKFNLLIIEDDPDIFNILQSKLAAPDRNVFICSNAQEAEEILGNNAIDFIITDLILPDLDGRLLVKKIRQAQKMSGVPIYVLTGMDAPSIRNECLALGATGFFTKPFNPDTFAAEVGAKIRESIQQLPPTRQDTLTGLPDQPAFRIALEAALKASKDSGNPLCLALFNLDYLSKINERYGRSIGDQILAYIAKALSKLAESKGSVFRAGGDIFHVILPGINAENALRWAEHAAKEIGEIRFEVGTVEAVFVTLSGSVVKCEPGADMEETLSSLERLLFKAKGAGRARIFSESTPSSLTRSTKVLVADDDDLITSLIRHRLGNEGMDVTCVQNGNLALQAAQKSSFGLIILDVQMTGMGGFEVLEKLRKISAYSRTPIVMLTSLGSEKDIVRGFELGATDYIVKPFSPGELMARTLRLLKG